MLSRKQKVDDDDDAEEKEEDDNDNDDDDEISTVASVRGNRKRDKPVRILSGKEIERKLERVADYQSSKILDVDLNAKLNVEEILRKRDIKVLSIELEAEEKRQELKSSHTTLLSSTATHHSNKPVNRTVSFDDTDTVIEDSKYENMEKWNGQAILSLVRTMYAKIHRSEDIPYALLGYHNSAITTIADTMTKELKKTYTHSKGNLQ